MADSSAPVGKDLDSQETSALGNEQAMFENQQAFTQQQEKIKMLGQNVVNAEKAVPQG